MTFIHSFPPVIDQNARVLILGSMPGKRSLQQNQYYAHPRNAFWSLMDALVGASPQLDYAHRLRRLSQHRIALWDVLKLCTRQGSLDSAIVESSIICNDFAGLFSQFPAIHHVFFNGAKAQAAYQRYVAPTAPEPKLVFTRLPSTSPAHAALPLSAKLAAWRAVRDALADTALTGS